MQGGTVPKLISLSDFLRMINDINNEKKWMIDYLSNGHFDAVVASVDMGQH